MPDASTQTEQGIAPTRKPISEITQKKYDQAIKRITDAGLDLDDTKKVLAWIKEKGGDSAQKVYLSALKYELGKRPHPFHFPTEYQEEIDRLYGKQNEKDKKQELTEKQVSNYVPYEKLLAIQKHLAEKEDKTDKEWKHYVVASLYTLQPPVRADYGEMIVVKKRLGGRSGNELIWKQKAGTFFLFREYKTKGTYGEIEIRVAPALVSVLEQWFAHLGKTPRYLLGKSITPNDLLGEIQDTFKSTKKVVGVNLLRHAYIQHHLPDIATNTKKREELAAMMLHSVDRQQAYFSQNV